VVAPLPNALAGFNVKVECSATAHSETAATMMDVLVRPVVPFPDLRRDATIIDIGPLKMPVVSIEHLIAMKTGTGRSKDVIDIQALRKIQAGKMS
jgi:hypothetical protein